MSEPALAVAPAASSPFKFLDFFEEADHDLFAGRDREVNEVLAGILRARTLVLYGRSGLGKTSLLLAGLFPEIRKRGLTPVYMRPFDQPLEDLRTALKETFPSLDLSAESTFEDVLRTASTKQGIVLVLDQLEELFIRFRERSAVRWNFIEAIAGVAKDPSLEVRIIFSLREDYLAELDDFREQLPELFANEYRLRPLTAFGARQAISIILINADLSYEQRLLTGLVDALEEYRYDPTILQILCSELYREMALRPEASRTLKAADLERLGGLEGIFRSYLENLGKALHPEQRLLAMVVLDSLVTREHTKKAVTVESLIAGHFVADREEVTEVLKLLVSHRLVRRVERDTETRFELIHDRLVEHVQDWLRLDPRFFELRSVGDLVANIASIASFRSQPDFLLTSGQIRQLVGEYRERLRFTELQLDLLFRSAVFRRVQDVCYWVKRFGSKRSLDAILDMLSDSNPEVRRGAAEAAGRLSVSDDRLANRCLALSLDDPDEEIRRLAGNSWAAVGQSGPPAVALLTDRLHQHKTRDTALETLADLAQVGDPLTGISQVWQRRARKVVRSRLLKKQRDAIRKIGRVGGLYGALAGLVYSLCVIASPLWWMVWALGTFDEPAEFWELLGLSSLYALGLGTLLGWRVAVSSAKVSAISEAESWFHGVWRSATNFLIWLVGFPIITALLFEEAAIASDSEETSRLVVSFCVLWVVVPLLGHTCTALQALLGQLCLRNKRNRIKIWLSIAFLTLGFPSLIPLLGNPLLVWRSSLESDAMIALFLGSWCTLSVLWSFTSFVSITAQTFSLRGASKEDEGEPSPAQRKWPFPVAVIASVGTAVATAAIFGFDTLPWGFFVRDISVQESVGPANAEETAFNGYLGPGIPDSDYYRVRCSQDEWSILTAREIAPAGEAALSGYTLFSPNDPSDYVDVPLKAGVHLLRLSAGLNPRMYHLRFTCTKVFDLLTSNILLDREPVYVRVRLEREASGVWGNNFTGRLSPNTWRVGERLILEKAFLVTENKDRFLASSLFFNSGGSDEKKVEIFLKSSGIGDSSIPDWQVPITSQGGWEMSLKARPYEEDRWEQDRSLDLILGIRLSSAMEHFGNLTKQ